MTTQELRSYIDRILGNSLRVLLPSYWWKRLFGMVVDKVGTVDAAVDAVGAKVKSIGQQVAELKDSNNSVWVTVSESANSDNKVAFEKIKLACINNHPISVYSDLGDTSLKEVWVSQMCIYSKFGEIEAIGLEFNREENNISNIQRHTYGMTLTADGTCFVFKEPDQIIDSISTALSKKASVTYVDERLVDVEQGVLAYVDTAIEDAITNTLNTAV